MKQFDSLIEQDLYVRMYQLSEWNNDVLGRIVDEKNIQLLKDTEWYQQALKEGLNPVAIHIHGAQHEGKMVVRVFSG